MRRGGLCIVTYVLAIVVVFVMVRIEWLNVEAGGRLPSREYRDGNPAEGVVTWRSCSITTETGWRRFSRIDKPLEQPLTPAERSQMVSDIHKEQSNNALLAFVETAGLLQYILVPMLVVLSLTIVGLNGWRYGGIPLIAGTAAGVVMFYRSYFTSLG
jgi:hypothetical protein